jgi:hypothetical protein
MCEKCGEKKAYYNYESETGMKYCIDCKEDGMKSKIKTYKCECGKEPYYNYPNEKQGKYCAKCKKEGMVNVRSKKCKCGKGRPIYNVIGERGLYCSLCKTNEMVNVHQNTCECGRIPSFGIKNATHCAKCKTEDMIYLRSSGKKCKVCNEKQRIYGFPGEKPEYCADCKEDGMINLKQKKCVECKENLAYYNYEGKKPEFCTKCKTEKMIRIHISNICVTCNKKEAYFNVPNTAAKYCGDCKKEGMVNTRSKKCKCNTSMPLYNFPDQKSPICCAQCKSEGMINVVHAKCVGIDGVCPYGSIANKKYKNHCIECFRRKYPLDPLTFTIRSKTKEIAVRDFINANFEGFEHDAQMQTGHCNCTIRRRIDHRKLINNTLIAVETDENQHKGYNEMNEETRYDDLYMAYSGKWIYIRFNPDKYKDKYGRNRNPSMIKRLTELKTEIEKQIKRVENGENEELVERIYMYYDETSR